MPPLCGSIRMRLRRDIVLKVTLDANLVLDATENKPIREDFSASP
jgi:hypothetical protein